MKVAFFVLATVLAFASADEDVGWLSEMLNDLKAEHLEEKIVHLQGMCSGNQEAVKVAAREFEHCVDDVIDFETKTICGIMKADYQNCTVPFVRVLTSCMDDEYKDIPGFLVNTVHNVVSYICRVNGQHFMELSNPCFWNSESTDLKKCEDLIEAKIGELKQEAKTTSGEYCEFFETINGCFNHHLRAECKHPVTVEAYSGLYQALTKECKNIKNNNL
ncbi:uncharacterized protein LOC109597127 [Aethina tumida]|uniref:uncharacterized protein LOC109597127 n=1 Tax=Aethina tumida TaxID=116153 RepID=UPI00096AED28|nr:uncharacterized protein LOC109597127 [Aethina tumida]